MFKIKTLTVFVAMLCVLFASARAEARSCYTPEEFEAEQGLRIHSELMVIGLTCAKMPNGAGLYSKYQSFTQKNGRLISMYENTLIDYYRRQGDGNAEKSFHTLRTGLANKVSKLAIANVSGFCHAFTPRLDAALNMDQNRLRLWAQQPWRDAPTSKPVCTRRASR